MEFKDLPVEIQERMPRNAEVFERDITATVPAGGFN